MSFLRVTDINGITISVRPDHVVAICDATGRYGRRGDPAVRTMVRLVNGPDLILPGEWLEWEERFSAASVESAGASVLDLRFGPVARVGG